MGSVRYKSGLLLAILFLLVPLEQVRSADFRTELEKRLDAELLRAGLLERAGALRAQGADLLARKQSHAAIAKFKQAQDVLLSGGEDNFYEPAIHTAYLELGRTLTRISPNSRARGSLAAGYTTGHGSDVVNQAVIRLRQGRYAEAALKRLRPNEGAFRASFRSAGVPEELIYLGLIESGYDPNAVSRAGAVGVWQFVPGTAKRYGLRYSGATDERRDPTRSASAAARYLSDLNRMFGDWLLALAAYNAGEYRILKIIQETGTSDFWELHRRGALPKETADYVPSVLAAVELSRKTGTTQRPNTPIARGHLLGPLGIPLITPIAETYAAS